MRALLSLRNRDIIIDTAMKSFVEHTPKPYLVPLCSFFPDLNSAQIMEIPVGVGVAPWRALRVIAMCWLEVDVMLLSRTQPQEWF